MAQTVEIESGWPVAGDDVADTVNGNGRAPYNPALATDRDIVVNKITGAFFFGAAAGVGAALDRIGEHPKAYVVDFSAVPIIDSTGAATMAGFARKAVNRGTAVYIAGASGSVRHVLWSHGLRPPEVSYEATPQDALQSARAKIGLESRESMAAT